MYVLDTNTLIYFFRGQGGVARVLLSKAPAEIGVPAIVLYELELGIAKSGSPEKRMQQLNALMSVITVIPFSAEEARTAARVRATLELQGTPIGPYDVLIAATAMTHRGILVTNNRREFGRIRGLHLENWYAS